MDSSTSTASLLLFPTYISSPPHSPSRPTSQIQTHNPRKVELYHQLQLTASLPLPAPIPPPKDEQYLPAPLKSRERANSYGSLVGRTKLPQPSSGFSGGKGRPPPLQPGILLGPTRSSSLPLSVMIPSRPSTSTSNTPSTPPIYQPQEETWEEREARRRQRREERKIQELTSWRSEDGLLSPPPMPRRSLHSSKLRKKGNEPPPPPSPPVGDLARLKTLTRSQSTPNLHGLYDRSSSTSVSSAMSPPSPGSPPYSSAASTMSMADLTLSSSHSSGLSGKRTGIDFNRPKPYASRTSAYSEESSASSSIKPPSPSLLRPKSFWASHPRSALYQPSSYLVRRGTFVAAGLDIDECADSPCSPLGRSSWNASSLALAVESRTEMLVCVPGSEF